jgi:hypothetical protein
VRYIWVRNYDEEGLLCDFWMKQFKPHPLWYNLQTPVDCARSDGNKEVADMIENFKVCFDRE